MKDAQELRQAAEGFPDAAALLRSYACSAAMFAGAPDALYERHLKFDNIVDPQAADARERYDAAARAVRDILSDRWLRTNQTYERENPKRIYYVSIEFLIGRSLSNNILNLMLDPVVGKTFDERGRQWMELLEKEPDAGLGNGGLGRLAAASSIRWRPWRCRQWVMACGTSTAYSGRVSTTAGSRSARTTG